MLWTVALLLLCSLKLASSTEERQNATTYGNENNGDKDIRGKFGFSFATEILLSWHVIRTAVFNDTLK